MNMICYDSWAGVTPVYKFMPWLDHQKYIKQNQLSQDMDYELINNLWNKSLNPACQRIHCANHTGRFWWCPRLFHTLLAQPFHQAFACHVGCDRGVWKTMDIPGHVISQCLAVYLQFCTGEGSPIFIFYQPITPKVTCLIPHWLI